MKPIQEVAAHWIILGIHLGLSSSTLKAIQLSNSCVEDCCDVVIDQWLRGYHRLPITWATLIKVLKETDFNVLAYDLEVLLEEFGKLWEEMEEIKEIGELMKEE